MAFFSFRNRSANLWPNLAEVVESQAGLYTPAFPNPVTRCATHRKHQDPHEHPVHGADHREDNITPQYSAVDTCVRVQGTCGGI